MAPSTSLLAGCTLCYLSGYYVITRRQLPAIASSPLWHCGWLSGFGALLVLILRNVVLVPVFLPALLTARMNRQQIDEQLRQLRAPQYTPLTFRTSDGVLIDGLQWNHPTPTTRWVLWLNPNAATFEEVADSAVQSYGIRLGANMVFFNYRGVGRSAGTWPRVAADLVEDGKAAMQYILSQGVREEDVLVYGWSLGGGIGTAVRALWPKGPIVSDRSFASLSVAAKFHAAGPLGIVIGMALFGGLSLASLLLRLLAASARVLTGPARVLYLLGIAAQLFVGLRSAANLGQRASLLLIGAVFTVVEQAVIAGILRNQTDRASFAEIAVTTLQHIAIGEVLGIAVWYSRALGLLAPRLLRVVGWEMDCVRPWRLVTGRTLILHHAADGILPPQTSLFRGVGAPADAIELTKRFRFSEPTMEGQACHCYPPVEDRTQFPQVLARVQALFV